MLTIGGAAGAASFTHVHNVVAAHGQPGWLAWADAIVLELMSIASGLELRRRKRTRVSVRFPAAVLGCAVVLSLAAQVVEAEPSPIGWTAAAVPALGFLVMVKIALGYTGAATRTSTPNHAGPVTRPSQPAPSRRRSADGTVHLSTHERRPQDGHAGPAGRDRGPSADGLLPAALRVRNGLAVQGRQLTRGALVEALRGSGHTVSNVRASELLTTLRAQPPLAAGQGRSGQPATRATRRPPATTAISQHQQRQSSTATDESLKPRTLDQRSGEPRS